MAESRLIGGYPVIGIRPTIDGRRGPLKVRESLEDQTMGMALRAKKLIEENGESGEHLLVIGDGKVEIALGAENNAFTLGVATDEEHRCGLNPVKKSRLENAGADAIIGDFENIDELLSWMK